VNLIDELTRTTLRVAPGAAAHAFYLRERWRGEPSIVGLDRLVQPGAAVVDIGAHRGVYTRRMATLVGQAGHVHAFEPNPEGIGVLRAAVGGRANVTIHQLALSSAVGEADLFRPIADGRRVDAMSSLSASGIRSDVAHETVRVQVSTVDHALAGEARRISFMKIDVEGLEHDVLLGAEGRLRRDHPALLIEIEQRHRDLPVGETFAWLASLGYVGVVLRRGVGERPIAEFDVPRDQLDHLGEGFGRGRPNDAYVTDFLFRHPGSTAAA
jgi:FkbM family methyltransferase